MIITITNADSSLIKIIETLNEKLVKPYEIISNDRTATNITLNGYTKEFENEILQDLEDIKNQRKAGKLKTYNSAKEAFRSEGLI